MGRAARVVAIAAVALGVMVPAAHGDNIAQTRALIEKLSSQLNHELQASGSLNQAYLTAQGRLARLNVTIATLGGEAASEQVQLNATSHQLVKAVVRSYVDGAAATQSIPYFNLNVTQQDARQLYEREVNSSLRRLQEQLQRQQNSLRSTLATESHQRHLAIVEAHQIRGLIQQNNIAVANLKVTLAQMNSQLSTKIVGYELYTAIYCAMHHKDACVEHAWRVTIEVGGTAAGNILLDHVAAVQRKQDIGGTAAGSKGGLAAVAAAVTQIGVPYVWGGEAPGVGFDCSGLTQWAWGRAGYSIPRTAAEQYYAMRHVPLNSLRPGDLLFYYNLDNDHQIDHVVMYVGSGPYGSNTIIAAAYTGTNISFEPLFTDGLYGAGRP